MPTKRRKKSALNAKQQRELAVQIEFMEGLLRREPQYVEALQILGDTYTRCGRNLDGLRVDEQLARIQPENPVVHYNLACSYSLTGQLPQAAAVLDRALELGFRDFQWLARDPDLHRLRKDPLFQTVEAKIRQLKIHIE